MKQNLVSIVSGATRGIGSKIRDELLLSGYSVIYIGSNDDSVVKNQPRIKLNHGQFAKGISINFKGWPTWVDTTWSQFICRNGKIETKIESNDPENVEASYRKQSGADEASHEGMSKLKHFFSKAPDAPAEFIAQSEYIKRMCVITTFGRCLLFARKNKINQNSNLFYDLEYEIDLSQLGVRIKEVVPEKKTSSKDIFVVQTPFKTFVFQTDESDTLVWLHSLTSAIKSKNERFTNNETSINPIANKAALLAEQEAETQLNGYKTTKTPFLTKRRSSFTSQRQKQNNNGKLGTRPISSGSRMLSRSEQIFRTNK